MPTELPIQPHDWSSLTPIGVCLGLLTVIVLVGIPWLLVQHRREREETHKEFLEALTKEEQFRNAMSDRYEQERKRMHEECRTERQAQWERYESSLREIVQSSRSRRQ